MIPSEHTFIRVGHARKSFGTEGHMRCSIDWEVVDDIPRDSFLFIEMDGIKVPFQVQEIDERDSPLIRFAGIDNPQEALQISNHPLYKLDESGTVVTQEEEAFSQWVGCYIYDNNSDQKIGKVEEVREMPAQWMAVIKTGDEEILIPLVHEFIEEFDQESGVIYMTLPEGILDL